MIRITNIRMGIDKIINNQKDKAVTGAVSDDERELIEGKICKTLHCSREEVRRIIIERKSVDARKKGDVFLVYTALAEVMNEKNLRKRVRDENVTFIEKEDCQPNVREQASATRSPSKEGFRPIVVGMGPAGLFCAYRLAKMGLCPILLERGMDVDARVRAVHLFWETNQLDEDTNVQFGEGGAGTFSDGKLNTMVRDVSGRNREVLNVFVEHGAPPEIAYLSKPHIGTDRLREVVKNIRKTIISLGGEIRFQTKLEGIEIEGGRIRGCRVKKSASEFLPCRDLVLAVGHSARDTFHMLHENGVQMTCKPFAVGVRIEHLQNDLNASQYGGFKDKLPPADYKLTHHTGDGRGVYSFCMCPGGFVVNASSEKDGLAINGMSNYNRGERNGNSAIVVTVTPEDFIKETMKDKGFPKEAQRGMPEVFMGMEFQRKYERRTFQVAGGLIPVQNYGDFKQNKESKELDKITPNIKGRYGFANVRECLPSYVGDAIIEGIQAFDKKIRGFADSGAVISGIETRTSSPVRILRDETLQSNIKGLYPCGEGAGYAGGIMSAAMDGLKVGEAFGRSFSYQPVSTPDGSSV